MARMFVTLRGEKVLNDVQADFNLLFERTGLVLVAWLVKVYPAVHAEAGLDQKGDTHMHVT